MQSRMPSTPRVLITGAGSGLGRELARIHAAAGARVLVADIDVTRARETLQLLSGTGHLCASADVTRSDDWDRLHELVQHQWQGLDLLYNNAGIASGGAIAQIDPAEWDRVLAINLTGVWLGVRRFVPGLLAQGHGRVVNTASIAGFVGAPYLGAYAISKAGVIAMSEGLLAELLPQGVGVSVVCPGFFQSRLLESLQVERETVGAKAAELMAAGPLSATEVAQYVVAAVNRGEFFIVPHREGRMLRLLKRLWPNFYYRKVRQRYEKLKTGKS